MMPNDAISRALRDQMSQILIQLHQSHFQLNAIVKPRWNKIEDSVIQIIVGDHAKVFLDYTS